MARNEQIFIHSLNRKNDRKKPPFKLHLFDSFFPQKNQFTQYKCVLIWKFMEIIFKMDFLDQGLNYFAHSNSRGEAKLKKASEQHQELQCKLLERIQALELQTKLIKQSLSDSPLIRLKTTPKLHRNQGNLARMLDLKKKQEEEFSQALLQKQITLEDVAFYRSLLKEYEQKIFQMGCNVYSKEVDISVEHIGKKQSQKPSLRQVRQFSRKQVEFSNLEKFLQEVKKISLELSEGTEKQTVQQQSQFIKSQTLISHKQIAEKYSSIPCSKKKIYLPANQPHILPNECSPMGGRKVLLVNTEKNNFYQNAEDSTYSFALSLLSKQLQREKELKRSYQQAMKCLEQKKRQIKDFKKGKKVQERRGEEFKI